MWLWSASPPPSHGATADSKWQRLGWALLALVLVALGVTASLYVFLACLVEVILGFGAHCGLPAWWVAATAGSAGGSVWAGGRAWDRCRPAEVARAAVSVSLLLLLSLTAALTSPPLVQLSAGELDSSTFRLSSG